MSIAIRRRKRATFWIGLILGGGLFGYLLLRYDPGRVLLPLLESRWELLAAVVGLQLGIQSLNAVSPAVLIGPASGRALSLWARSRVFLALQPVALLTPGRLSDFGALIALKRNYPTGAVASAVVVDKLITLFVLLLLTPVALRAVWTRTGVAIDIVVITGVAVIAATPFLLVNRRFRELINRYVLSAWPSLLEGFGTHTEALLRASKVRVAVNLGLTCLRIILAGLALSILAHNFDASLAIGPAVWMSVLIQLATSLPLAPQGLGIAEGTLVLLFAANGLSEAAAMSVGVTGRGLLLLLLAVVYLTVTLPEVGKEVAAAHSHTFSDPTESDVAGAASDGRGADQ